jgi:hypothetical protein
VRRLFWLGVGVAVGVVAARQVTRTMRAYSPAGIADQTRNTAAGLIESVRDFVADVRDGMAEREEMIHSAFEQGVSLDELERNTVD